MIYSSRAGLMGIVHSLLLKSLPLHYHCFNQGSAFDNTLLWWTPLTFSSARRNSPQEDIFYDAEVAFHLRRKEQSNRCIFHVEVLTALRMPAANIFLRSNNLVMQPFIEVVSRCSPGETVEVCMKDGLPENAMLPEYGRSIKAC